MNGEYILAGLGIAIIIWLLVMLCFSISELRNLNLRSKK